jgi:hypothetical protein
MEISYAGSIFCRYVLVLCRLTKRAAFAVCLAFSILIQHSCSADGQREGTVVAHQINVSSANVEFTLGINKDMHFSFIIEKPTILHLNITGEVEKKISGGYEGEPYLELIQANTRYVVPQWRYDTKFRDKYTPTAISASYLLNEGEYIIAFRGVTSGRSKNHSFETDSLALKLNTKSEEMVSADWLPRINFWLDDIGLGDKIHIIASSRGPSFGFNKVSKDEHALKVVTSMMLDRKNNQRDQFLPNQSVESVENEIDSNKLFIFVSTQLDREALNNLEFKFYQQQGVTLWSRLFRKITLHTGVPSKDIFGLVPVACDQTDLYEDTPGSVHRHGWVCMSASEARATPKWLSKRLGMGASSLMKHSTETFAKIVEQHLNSISQSIGGTVEYLYREDAYVEAIFRGARGWVIRGNNQWEKVQISFALMGKDKPQIRISVDGMLASGLGDRVPADSRFTYSMEPEYSSNLTTFARKMLDDFVNSKGVD